MREALPSSGSARVGLSLGAVVIGHTLLLISKDAAPNKKRGPTALPTCLFNAPSMRCVSIDKMHTQIPNRYEGAACIEFAKNRLVVSKLTLCDVARLSAHGTESMAIVVINNKMS